MKAKFCFRFNLRTVVGTFMCLVGTTQLAYAPQLYSNYIWGWSFIPVMIGGALLAWGEFCEKGDC